MRVDIIQEFLGDILSWLETMNKHTRLKSSDDCFRGIIETDTNMAMNAIRAFCKEHNLNPDSSDESSGYIPGDRFAKFMGWDK